MGRFLSRDPLIIPRSSTFTNPYAFAFNDPVNFTDPSGLDASLDKGFGICATSSGDSCGGTSDSLVTLPVGLGLGTAGVVYGFLTDDGSVNSAPQFLGKDAMSATFPASNIFTAFVINDDVYIEGNDVDFYSRSTKPWAGGIDYYDPDDITYHGPPIISWAYGDPTQDIGKLPPFRVVARAFFEWIMSGAPIPGAALSIPRAALLYPMARARTVAAAWRGMAVFRNRFPLDVVGLPIQTFTAKQVTAATFSRRLNYVVMESGELRFGRISRGVGGGHIDLAGGEPVLAAGEVHFVDGRLKYIDNSSGHYLPRGPKARAQAEHAFRRVGIEPGDAYIEKVWNGSAWVPR